MSKLYEYRKAQGLCVNCGDRAEMGKSRCLRCLQIEAVKAKERYHTATQEQRRAKRERERILAQNNPQRMEVYKSRKSEYNRRYRNG